MRPAILVLLLAACSAHPPAGSSGTGGSGGEATRPVEICDNGIDDDGNDLVDCADPACREDAHCPVCGDGFLDGREACELADLRGQSCASLGYDGGILTCSMTCQLDTSSCIRHERCDVPGDEDGNGKADCADPACAGYPSCWKLVVKTLQAAADVSSPVKLILGVTDGAGRPLSGVPILVTPPVGAYAGPALATDGIGQASFPLRLGRLPGDVVFTASILGTDVSVPLTVRAREPAAGTVLTVVNGTASSGQDESGPAVAAALGAILDVQVSSSGELYLAESCRILVVSKEGVLSRLAGDGTCSGADDGAPPTAGIAVAALALDDGILYFADPLNARIRAIDLAAGTMRTVASGLEPNALTLQGGVLHASDARGNRLVRVALDSGVVTTEVAGVSDADKGCTVGAPSLQDCASAPCRTAVNPAGSLFTAGLICGYTVSATGVDSGVPAILRLDGARRALVAGIPPARPSAVASDLQFPSVPPMAFDAGGNLFAFAGNALLRVDGVSTVYARISAGTNPGFSGDDQPVAQALFSGPSTLAFGPDGDLYVADTGNAAVRRIVGIGASKPSDIRLTALAGDGQKATIAHNFTGRINFKITDAAGAPLVAPTTLVSDDPGAAVFNEGTLTGADGTGQRAVRAGIVPGPEIFKAYALGLDGKPGGTPAVFTLTALAPAAGAEVPLVGADSGTVQLGPDDVLPGPGTAVRVTAAVAASDGSFYLSALCQVVRLRPDGGLVLVAGAAVPNLYCQSSGDGGPAKEAGLVSGPLALDEKNGALYVASSNVVRAVDLHTDLISTVAGGGVNPAVPGSKATDAYLYLYALAADGQGKVYLASSSGLLRVDLASGLFDTFLSDHACPDGSNLGGALGVTASGDLLYLSTNYCGGLLAKLQADGSVQALLTGIDPFSMTIDSSGAPVFSGPSSADVTRYDLVTGESTLLHTFPDYVTSLTFTPEGRLGATLYSGPFTLLW